MVITETGAARCSGVGHESIDVTLSRPVLEFDLANELEELHRNESWAHPTGRSARTLVKYPDLRVALIAMKVNMRVHEYTAAGGAVLMPPINPIRGRP